MIYANFNMEGIIFVNSLHLTYAQKRIETLPYIRPTNAIMILYFVMYFMIILFFR